MHLSLHIQTLIEIEDDLDILSISDVSVTYYLIKDFSKQRYKTYMKSCTMIVYTKNE